MVVYFEYFAVAGTQNFPRLISGGGPNKVRGGRGKFPKINKRGDVYQAPKSKLKIIFMITIRVTLIRKNYSLVVVHLLFGL